MNNLANSFLKYGDEVLLYSEQMVGLLYSEGWFDQKVYLPKIEKDKLKYHHLFVFVVNPKSVNSFKSMENLTKKRTLAVKPSIPASKKPGLGEEALAHNGSHPNEEDQNKLDDQEFVKNKEILEKRRKQEEYYNKRTRKAKYGVYVAYGNEIELVHKASGKVVTIVKSSTVVDAKMGLCLELREGGVPDRCDFKIMPRYKYRAEGEKIMYGDFFVLYNEATKNYVHISENVVSKTDLYESQKSYRPKTKFRRTPNNSLFSKYIMEMKSRNSSQLQLIPFRHAEHDSERYVSGGDIVRIKHTEIGGHLCIDGSLDSDKGPQCFVRKYRGTDAQEEKYDSNCLFEIEMNCKVEKGRFVRWRDSENGKAIDVTDLLGLNSSNLAQDQNVLSNTTFRLRHFNSGQHLTVTPGGDKGKFTLCLASHKDNKDDFYSDEYLQDTLFTLESQSVDPDERLKPSIVLKLKHVKSNTYISTATSIERSRSLRTANQHEKRKSIISSKKIIELDEAGNTPFKLNTRSAIDTDVAKHRLECSPLSKDEDAFVVEQLPVDYLRECMSIHAAIPILKEYVWDIRMGREEKLRNKERMKRLERVLTDLIFFVTETEDGDPYTCEGIPYRERQKLMREINTIEVLCDALYFPFAENMFSLETLADVPTLSNV